jgi:hypothetical protein
MSLVTTVSLPAACGVKVPAAGDVDLSPQAARTNKVAKSTKSGDRPRRISD